MAAHLYCKSDSSYCLSVLASITGGMLFFLKGEKMQRNRAAEGGDRAFIPLRLSPASEGLMVSERISQGLNALQLNQTSKRENTNLSRN